MKLKRDQNDMFDITGIGNSEEYVKQLVNTFVNLGIRNYEEYRTAELRNFLNARDQRLREIQTYQQSLIERLHALHRKYGIIHPKEEMDNVKKIQGEQNATLAELNVKLADARQRFGVAEKDYKALPPNVIKHRGKLREFISDMRKVSREYEKAKLMFAERNPRFVEAKTAYEVIQKEFETFKTKNNINVFEENMLLGIDGIINRYQEAEVALSQVELSMKSLQAEIAIVKEKEKKLQHMIPEHDSVE